MNLRPYYYMVFVIRLGCGDGMKPACPILCDAQGSTGEV
jgi:hypothetical protein